MKAKVVVVGKEEFKNKSGKTSYLLHLMDVTEDNVRVHRAFTASSHYNKLEVSGEYEGYLNFENGFTHFYLPKDEVK